MRILVTGARGKVGAATVTSLLRAGHDVTAADCAPIDEEHPIRPQDPYALAKHFGEQLMDAAVRRSDLRAISIRPSWVQWEGISIAKARRLVGYDPSRSWRDDLDDDGRLRPEVRQRLERGETGVQAGRAADAG